MSEQNKIFEISVLAEQGKNLLGTLNDSGDAGTNAVIFAVSDFLHRIQIMAESLEGGAVG